MKVAINPVILTVQPHIVKTVVAPARHRGRSNLISRELFEVLRQGDELNGPLFQGNLADEVVEPTRALKPPMAEQFSVVGRDNQRPAVHPPPPRLPLFRPP